MVLVPLDILQMVFDIHQRGPERVLVHLDIYQAALDNLQKDLVTVLGLPGIPVVLAVLDFPDMRQMVLNMFLMVAEVLACLVLV